MSAPDDWVPDVYVPLAGDGDGVLIPLDSRQKDEWLHHLYVRFRELGRGISAATKTSPDGFRYEERWFNGDGSSALVRLMVVNGNAGLYVFLGRRGTGDPGAEADFRSAATYATESTGKRRETVHWEATIRQVPASRGVRQMGLRLSAPVVVRGLRLDNWSSLHSEEVPTWYPTMGLRGSPWFFWPIRVTGSARCYAWDEDGTEETAARLRFLVEILSLAFDWPMEVLVGPYEATMRVSGDENRVVPGVSAPLVPHGQQWTPEWPVDVPAWALEALNGAVFDPRVQRALSAHYEATLLKNDQPSMALLGFAASIETLAVPRRGLPRCTECASVVGMGQRFRDAIGQVLSPAEGELLGSAYNRRSRTAHDAMLHGSEGVLGMFPVPRLFSPDTRSAFEWGTVHLAAKASRELLLNRVDRARDDPPP